MLSEGLHFGSHKSWLCVLPTTVSFFAVLSLASFVLFLDGNLRQETCSSAQVKCIFRLDALTVSPRVVQGYGSCLNESRDGGGAAADRIAAPPRKKARTADSSDQWQLRPRSAIRSRREVCHVSPPESLSLVEAMFWYPTTFLHLVQP